MLHGRILLLSRCERGQHGDNIYGPKKTYPKLEIHVHHDARVLASDLDQEVLMPYPTGCECEGGKEYDRR